MNNKIRRSLIGLGAVVILWGSTVVFSEPGSDSDPLVTLSYVNKTVDQIKTYVDEKISKVSGVSNELVIVDVKKGQYLIGKSGTEFILRAGKAKVVGSALGGLSDVTSGEEINHDQALNHNHLLIIPRSDDRGIYATEDAILMVKGSYELK